MRHNSVEPNSPLLPGLPGNDYKKEVQPLAEEKIFSKTVNNAFIGTDLENYLREHKIQSLVIVG